MTAYTRTEHLRHELAEQIRNGTLKPGERIMSETRLAEEYQVSRGTVRRALEQLKKAELIETRMGSGSYVAFNGGDMSGPDGWTSASLRSGAPTTTELLSIALVGRPLALEGESECERFYEIARRRLFRSTPVSYEVSYLPAIPALREVIERIEGLVDGSISKTMKQAGLQAASGYMDVSADRLGPIAQALKKTPETVFLLSERHNFSDDGTLVEYVRSFLDPSHFTLHVTAGENGGNHGDR